MNIRKLTIFIAILIMLVSVSFSQEENVIRSKSYEGKYQRYKQEFRTYLQTMA